MGLNSYTPYTFTYTPYTFTYTPYTFTRTPYTITRTPYTFTVIGDSGKTQKAPVKTSAWKQKKTETPIFQGISVVLPKLYLGGRSEGIRTPDILTSCLLRCPKLFARYSLRTILTATPLRHETVQIVFSFHSKSS